MMKTLKPHINISIILIVSLLTLASSCESPLSLGIKNPRHFKYSREEVKRATILSMSAKLEKKFHSDQKSSEYIEMDDEQLDEKSKQIDFLRRIKENE